MFSTGGGDAGADGKGTPSGPSGPSGAGGSGGPSKGPVRFRVHRERKPNVGLGFATHRGHHYTPEEQQRLASYQVKKRKGKGMRRRQGSGGSETEIETGADQHRLP